MTSYDNPADAPLVRARQRQQRPCRFALHVVEHDDDGEIALVRLEREVPVPDQRPCARLASAWRAARLDRHAHARPFAGRPGSTGASDAAASGDVSHDRRERGAIVLALDDHEPTGHDAVPQGVQRRDGVLAGRTADAEQRQRLDRGRRQRALGAPITKRTRASRASKRSNVSRT